MLLLWGPGCFCLKLELRQGGSAPGCWLFPWAQWEVLCLPCGRGLPGSPCPFLVPRGCHQGLTGSPTAPSRPYESVQAPRKSEIMRATGPQARLPTAKPRGHLSRALEACSLNVCVRMRTCECVCACRKVKLGRGRETTVSSLSALGLAGSRVSASGPPAHATQCFHLKVAQGGIKGDVRCPEGLAVRASPALLS